VVPVHLRAAFWDLLARAPEPGAVPAEGFGAFVAETARFLAFKQMPVPAGAGLCLVVAPGGPAARGGAPGRGGPVHLGAGGAGGGGVFLRGPAGGIPAAASPPVRLQLGPGEGVRIPAGLLVGTDGCERDQPDVLLLIRLPGAGGGEAPGGRSRS